MSARFNSGEVSGLPLMKFALTYRGELRSNDDYRRKWVIREHFDPQLRELWRVNPSLRLILRKYRYIPMGGFWHIDEHHSSEIAGGVEQVPDPAGDQIDLCEPIVVAGRQFLPLVRDTFALTCGLKILFLRKEEPGRVYQGGDLDNRVKTLFDALSVPNADQVMDKELSSTPPINCLLEDDRLITKIEVDTQRLLTADNASPHEVHLFIEVDVRVSQARGYNQIFLGD